jgi:formamidopyrimidine-DNA glycosylase
MPELPEVETIKNELAPLVTGRRIKSVEFLWAKTLLSPSIPEFDARVKGKIITGLERRGKYLILRLEGGDSLLVHLRMTGSFFVSRDKKLPSKHTRAVIRLDDGANMYFIDPRKFGKFQLVDGGPVKALEKLGPEPLGDAFTSAALAGLLARHKAPIKAALVDQEIIAGIGNMYADEILYAARLNPLRPSDSLDNQEIKRLHRAIKQVLKKAIENKGASISNYFRPGGEKGSAHEEFKVAHRKGECPVCGGPITRIVVRQRGTYFCPVCQA